MFEEFAKLKVYIASPYGFSEAGREFYNKTFLPMIGGLGVEIIDPWKLTSDELINRVVALPYGKEKRDEWEKLNRIIGENNRKGIERANGLVAVLDGTDVDSGTAAEIGYAASFGTKPIIGYRGDFRFASDNEGSLVNLQVQHFIEWSGGALVTSLDDLKKQVLLRILRRL